MNNTKKYPQVIIKVVKLILFTHSQTESVQICFLVKEQSIEIYF